MLERAPRACVRVRIPSRACHVHGTPTQAQDYEPACECYALAEAEMGRMGTQPSADNVATFLFNFARSCQGLGEMTRALHLFSSVLDASPDHYRALDHRAECHASLYDYESALADLAELTAHHAAGVEPAILKGGSGRTLDLKTEQRRAPRSVLGVEPTATDAEIKRAFRGLCLAWHPDTHAAASADTRARAKHKFARITAAHDKLQGAGRFAGGRPTSYGGYSV